MKIIAVVGTKDTGKTLLVTKIVRELVKRGFSVGTIKHVNHGFDLEGKDTWKHEEAGASLVIGANQDTFFQLNDKIPLDQILKITENLKKLDFMVIEGFKHSNYAKISVTDLNDEFTLKNVNPFNLNDEELQSLVDLIEKRSFSIFSQMNCGDCGFEGCNDMAQAIIRGNAQEMDCFMKKEKDVLLKFGGNEIPMNPFVQKFVKNTVMGMIKALKRTDDRDMPHKNIELLIRNEDN